MPTDEEINNRVIESIVNRLKHESRAECSWSDTVRKWVKDGAHNGNDNPPDVLPIEVSMRLSSYFNTIPTSCRTADNANRVVRRD